MACVLFVSCSKHEKEVVMSVNVTLYKTNSLEIFYFLLNKTILFESCLLIIRALLKLRNIFDISRY